MLQLPHHFLPGPCELLLRRRLASCSHSCMTGTAGASLRLQKPSRLATSPLSGFKQKCRQQPMLQGASCKPQTHVSGACSGQNAHFWPALRCLVCEALHRCFTAMSQAASNCEHLSACAAERICLPLCSSYVCSGLPALVPVQHITSCCAVCSQHNFLLH